MSITKELIKNFFSKPATEKYPFEKKQPKERFRGRILYDSKNALDANYALTTAQLMQSHSTKKEK